MFILAIGASVVIVEFGNDGLGDKTAMAGSGDNVTGWAWSSNIGWISLNCTNDNSCATANYGVGVDKSTGNFSGYGWSSNVGWIDFAPTSGYPATPNAGARLDRATGQVTGWAKILSLGADGWIKMSDDSVAAWNGQGVKINNSTGDFSGWAWNSNDNGAGIGWLSFNCSNDSSCGSSNYKAITSVNIPPAAVNLTSPNWSIAQAGTNYALQAFTRWQFSDPDSGSSQSAYEVIVSPNSDFSLPTVSTGKTAGSANQYSLGPSQLAYNIPYYWKVRVWDDYDVAADWTQYNSAADTDNNDGYPLTFTTYQHEIPDPGFTWFPVNPSKGEDVKFTDASKVYLTGAPSTAVDCDDAKCDWLWTASNAVISDATASTTTITFNSAGAQSVKLKVTDNDGYFYEVTKSINASKALPSWRETKAK